LTERDKLIENHRQSLIEEEKRELKNNSDLITKFLEYCQKKNISITAKNIEYIQTIGIVANYPNILNLLNDRIKADKEDLVSFKILDKDFTKQRFASGYLISEMFMAMANPYFRRGHFEKNSFAPRFIELFWDYNSVENEKFISLDFNKVRINVDNLMTMEFDTWYGAKFDNKISNIEDGTVKLSPPLDLEAFDIEFFFGNVHSLNIKWYTKESIENGVKKIIKVFQAEEFKKPNSKIIKNNIEYFPAKYIHAEFDILEENFRHFDGALHFYNETEYYQRRDTDFNHNQKNDLQIKTLSQKLFKVNGKIEVNKWVELTSQFLTKNPLIIEYFEGKLPDKITELVNRLRAEKQ